MSSSVPSARSSVITDKYRSLSEIDGYYLVCFVACQMYICLFLLGERTTSDYLQFTFNLQENLEEELRQRNLDMVDQTFLGGLI